MNKLVSVVVPCYNVAPYLEKCIHSLLNQTYQNIEILLIDDGSTDNTPNICDYYASIERRVFTFHKQNGGVASARNVGIKKAIGDYIIFVDPDDWIDKRMIEKLLCTSIDTNAEIISCLYVRQFLFLKRKMKFAFEFEKIYDNEFIINNILKNLVTGEKDITAALNNVTKLIKADLLKSNGILYDEEWDHAEDVEFMVRVLLKTQSIYFLNYAPYHYMKYFGLKTLTSRHCPKRFNQRVRYRNFINNTLAPIYDLQKTDIDNAKIILSYAHEEAINLIKNITEKSAQIECLKQIFNHPEYQKAAKICSGNTIVSPILLEKECVINNDFKTWFEIISTNTQ